MHLGSLQEFKPSVRFHIEPAQEEKEEILPEARASQQIWLPIQCTYMKFPQRCRCSIIGPGRAVFRWQQESQPHTDSKTTTTTTTLHLGSPIFSSWFLCSFDQAMHAHSLSSFSPPDASSLALYMAWLWKHLPCATYQVGIASWLVLPA